MTRPSYILKASCTDTVGIVAAVTGFLTSRLVLDPGLNYFGWSLEEAREYMLENTLNRAACTQK